MHIVMLSTARRSHVVRRSPGTVVRGIEAIARQTCSSAVDRSIDRSPTLLIISNSDQSKEQIARDSKKK